LSPARLSVLATPTGQQRRGLFIATNGRQRSVKRITVSELQQSICLTKRNRALDISARRENTHLARTEARAGFGIIDGVLLLREHRLDAWRFKNFPAPRVQLSNCYF
jgi:hypothetical protein